MADLQYSTHRESQKDEVLLGFFSENHILSNVVWKTARIGQENIGNKYPLFVSMKEILKHKNPKFIPCFVKPKEFIF